MANTFSNDFHWPNVTNNVRDEGRELQQSFIDDRADARLREIDQLRDGIREVEAGLAEIADQHPEHDGFYEDGCPCCIARATLWQPPSRQASGST